MKNLVLVATFAFCSTFMSSATADRFSEFNSISPKQAKHLEPLSESKKSDTYMSMFVKQAVSRVLRMNGGLVTRYESLTTHNELTPSGIKSVLKTLEDMDVKEQLASNQLFMQPFVGRDAVLLERKVVDGVLTWFYTVPAEVEFGDTSKRSQKMKRHPYVFAVNVVRSNELHHHNRIAIDYVGLKD